MISILQEIETLYNALLIQKAVPVKFHSSYRKWLRYYLDFCQKYGFRQSDTKSLPHFIKKLKEKKQTDQQQKQAADAISIYYGEETIRENKNIVSKTNNKIISSKKDNLKPTNANWVPAYNDLNAEIALAFPNVHPPIRFATALPGICCCVFRSN
jgi:hypothetical protein